MTAVVLRPYEGVGRKISLLRHHHASFKSEGVTDGQAYFSALVQVDLDLANRLRDTTVDPYYHEDRIEFFLKYVYTYWGFR